MAKTKDAEAIAKLRREFDEVLSDLIGTIYSWLIFKYSVQDFDITKNSRFVKIINRNQIGAPFDHLQNVLLYDAVMRLCRITEHDTSEKAGRMTIFTICKTTEKYFESTHREELKELKPLKKDIKDYSWLKEAREFRHEYLAHNLVKREDVGGPQYKDIEIVIHMLSKLMNVIANILGKERLPDELMSIKELDQKSQRLWMALENGLLAKEIVENLVTNK